MKITELLKKETLSVSFEVFPPKTDTAFESVKEATEQIAALRPAFMSVTYGAGGGTSRYTLDIAKNIKEQYGVPTLAHLTCVSSDRDTVRTQLSKMKEYGIENVLALLKGADVHRPTDRRAVKIRRILYIHRNVIDKTALNNSTELFRR